MHSPPQIPSDQNRQFLREQVLKQYKLIADTSSHTIIRLITMYFVNESFSSMDQLDLMENIHSNIQDSDTTSPYYKTFLDEMTYIQYQRKSKNKYYWIVIIVFISLAFVIVVWSQFSKKRSSLKSKHEFSDSVAQLSLQEKRVMDLLRDGKSNKEISQELHIEVSTVKSHLNKIYSRLGVKSRKDIVNSNL